MRSVYKVFAWLIALGVFVQAAAIALAWFTVIADIEAGEVFSKDSDGNVGHAIHGIVGFNIMPILGLLFLIVSFFAKVPGGVKWAALTFAAIVVQVALAIVAFSTPAVGALHGINALLLFGLAFMAGKRVPSASTTARTDMAGEPELV